MRIFQSRRGRSIQKISFAAGCMTALVVVLAGLYLPKAQAADCDQNAIIYCGFSAASDFISTVRANDSRNGHHDLQTVYAAYGLEPTSYDKFVSSARPGTAYKDGRIVVDGQTVATNAKSIGRQAAAQGSGYFTQNIGGTNYYGNSNSVVFKSDSIPVMALFDSHGSLQFAVLTACGNPINGNNVNPNYSCDMLKMTPVSGKSNTYSFSAAATAGNNATISKLVYDFGDGSTATTTSTSASVQHMYTKGGTFTAKVTVYVKLPGNQETTVSSGSCQKTVTITIPFYECVQLAGAILDKSKYSYRFVATAKYGNGATLTSADFTFGDGTTAKNVKPADANTISADHAYAAAGTYSASAVLHFTVDGKDVTAAACKAVVTPTTPPTPECKPGVPVGSPLCTPCQYDTSLPADSPQCIPPALPNTGAGHTIAIFGAVAAGGFLVYRQLLFRKHRAAFQAAQIGSSPLPLGQPLDDNNPLQGTPLARVRKTLRRRRPF